MRGSYGARGIAANQRNAGSEMPIVKAMINNVNLSLGKDLGPSLDEPEFDSEERWLIITRWSLERRPEMV